MARIKLLGQAALVILLVAVHFPATVAGYDINAGQLEQSDNADPSHHDTSGAAGAPIFADNHLAGPAKRDIWQGASQYGVARRTKGKSSKSEQKGRKGEAKKGGNKKGEGKKGEGKKGEGKKGQGRVKTKSKKESRSRNARRPPTSRPTPSPSTACPMTPSPTTATPTTTNPTTASPTTPMPTTANPTIAAVPTVTPGAPSAAPTTLNPTVAPGRPTAAPTTTAPTTGAPSTPAPTTAGPTVTAGSPSATPTTSTPTTASPTTLSPTTSTPTSASPTSSAPATAGPTSPLATPNPTTAVPTTASPTSGTPTTASPTTVAPTTAAPTTATPQIRTAGFSATTESKQSATGPPATIQECTENPRYYTLSLDIQMHFLDHNGVAPSCQDNGQQASIALNVQSALNDNFAATVTDWHGKARFGQFVMDPDQSVNNLDSAGLGRRLRGGSSNIRYLEGGTSICPPRSVDCSPAMADSCLWGCLEVETTDCGSPRSATTSWSTNLAGDIQNRLASLGHSCLGISDQLRVVVAEPTVVQFPN